MHIMTIKSSHSVPETVQRLTKLLQAKGIKIFATIDHAQGARENNLELSDEVLLIFGDPKVGTFLMQENQVIGIDLPLKFLVWQDAQGTTWISYVDPVAFEKSYNIEKHRGILENMQKLLAVLANDAASRGTA